LRAPADALGQDRQAEPVAQLHQAARDGRVPLAVADVEGGHEAAIDLDPVDGQLLEKPGAP
jgi:hypothetical protein